MNEWVMVILSCFLFGALIINAQGQTVMSLVALWVISLIFGVYIWKTLKEVQKYLLYVFFLLLFLMGIMYTLEYITATPASRYLRWLGI